MADTDNHWSSHIFPDIKRAMGVTLDGKGLIDEIKRNSSRLRISLRCLKCTSSFAVLVTSIAEHYLKPGASSPSIRCNCGHSGAHAYDGVSH